MSSDKLNFSVELTNIEKILQSVRDKLDLENATESIDHKYTVFMALGNETDEDRTHIPFLYEMLNCDYGLKNLFLPKFFEMVLHEDYQEWTEVYMEYHIPKTKVSKGRMDLYIESKDACYPIEVKIYAKDQKLQIARYHRFAKNNNKANFKVFYLTLNGRKPSKMSLGTLKPTDKSLVCISFAENIYAWLIECAEIAAEKKRFEVEKAINQYKTLIEKLTGAEQENESMDEIRKLIASSKDNYLSATKIAKNINKVRIEKLKQLFKDLGEHLEKKWKLVIVWDDDSVCDNYYNNNHDGKGPGVSFILKEMVKEKLTIYFRIEVDGDLEYGVQFLGNNGEWCPSKYKMVRNAFDNEQWRSIIDNHNKKASNNCWLWWNSLRGILDADFSGCCNDDYIQLFDSKFYKTKLKMIKKEIDDNMQNIIDNGVSKHN